MICILLLGHWKFLLVPYFSSSITISWLVLVFLPYPLIDVVSSTNSASFFAPLKQNTYVYFILLEFVWIGASRMIQIADFILFFFLVLLSIFFAYQYFFEYFVSSILCEPLRVICCAAWPLFVIFIFLVFFFSKEFWKLFFFICLAVSSNAHSSWPK